MFDELRSKNVFVTGGSNGIGYEIVKKLLSMDMNVACTYCTNKLDEERMNYLDGLGNGKVVQCKLDINEVSSVKNAVKEIVEIFGSIEVLINNAGIIYDGFFMLMNLEKWGSVINTNLNGTVAVTKAVLPYLYKKSNTNIVNITSIAGFNGVSGQTNYCASKAGIIGFTKSLAKELSHKKIRVNAIAPGYIETKMIEKVSSKDKSLQKKIPLGRFGQGEDIANAVLFLISDMATYITGETIIVDGGLTC